MEAGITAALESLQERMTGIRAGVSLGSRQIGDIVAALPDTRRSSDIAEELERVVAGLNPARDRSRVPA